MDWQGCFLNCKKYQKIEGAGNSRATVRTAEQAVYLLFYDSQKFYFTDENE